MRRIGIDCPGRRRQIRALGRGDQPFVRSQAQRLGPVRGGTKTHARGQVQAKGAAQGFAVRRLDAQGQAQGRGRVLDADGGCGKVVFLIGHHRSPYAFSRVLSGS